MNTNTSGSFGGAYMGRLKDLLPNMQTSNSVSAIRSKRHSIQEARQAVVDKILANKEHFINPDPATKPDLIYKDQGGGYYSVGIKYGNRWLSKAFNGSSFITGIPKENVAGVMDLLSEAVSNGEMDKYIESIRDANWKAHGKGGAR